MRRETSHQFSRYGRRLAAAPEAGVTLVEMLVTLSIAALSAVLIITTARSADPLRSEGETLSQTLEQLDARARISGKPTGLVLDRAGYRAVVWDKAGWAPLPGTQHVLQTPVALRVPAPAKDDNSAQPAPALIFDPLGHSTLSPLTLMSGKAELTVNPPAAGARGTP